MTEQLDMSQFVAARSDQLNSDDLIDGPRTITITRVTGTGSSDQPVAVHYEGGEGRPFKPCKTVRRLMIAAWGKEAAKYVGRSMTLYRDPKVSFGGMEVGGIRVSHMSHLDQQKTLALLVTKGRKASFTIKPLKDAPKPQTDAFGLEPVTDGPAAPSKAEIWTEQYISNVADCSTMEELMDLQNRCSNTLAKLKAENGDLHEKATAAGTRRAHELQSESELSE